MAGKAAEDDDIRPGPHLISLHRLSKAKILFKNQPLKRHQLAFIKQNHLSRC